MEGEGNTSNGTHGIRRQHSLTRNRWLIDLIEGYYRGISYDEMVDHGSVRGLIDYRTTID